MLDKILSYFKNPPEETRNNPTQSVNLAAAALMIEVMKADHVIDKTEQQKIKELIKTTLTIDEKLINSLFEKAEKESEESVSLYQFTSHINEHMSRDEKIVLIENMWKVAFADGEIDRYEDHIIRKVSELIYVSHSEFMKAKHRAKDL